MSPILLEETDGRVRILTLNRPEALNAISSEMARDLVRAIRSADADESIGAVVLTGTGERAFTAGMDLKEAAAATAPLFDGADTDPHTALEECRTPVLAAVNGLCITGGMELILCCDIVFAASTARFADTHVRVGLLPGWGISARLARQIGPQRAKEISLSGNFVSAHRAAEIGLVNRVVEPDLLLTDVLALARDIADADGKVVQAYKELIDTGFATTLGEALPREHERSVAYARALSGEELRSGARSASVRNRAQVE